MAEEIREPRKVHPRALFGSLIVAGLVLRRDRVEHDRFRLWTFVPVLGVAFCILLLTQQAPHVWPFGAILLAVGVVLFLATRIGRGSKA